MKRAFNFFLVTVLSLSVISCATLLNGVRQKVTFTSNPTGAEVIINGKPTGKTTPCQIRVKRSVRRGENNLRNQYVYDFSKPGFVPYSYSDKADKSAKIWLNLIYLPASYLAPALLILPGIDLVSGSMNMYEREVHARLVKEQNYVVIRDTVVRYVDKGIGKPTYEFKRNADVDKDIPSTGISNQYRFALVIGNEDYRSHQLDLSSESNVEFARNDASAFRDYAIQTFGIPERNMIFLLDATSGQIHQALSKINLLTKSSMGKAEVFFYYAGHGLPDEITREPYLMPVDVSGKNVHLGIKLADVYQKLTEHPGKGAIAFIDACFSGGARNQGLLAARGVKVKPRENSLSGNLLVLTASSGDQSSLPLRSKEHGIFTYWLLSKIKETKGDISYKELSQFLLEKVGMESILVNDKEQTPSVLVSPDIKEVWEGLRLR